MPALVPGGGGLSEGASAHQSSWASEPMTHRVATLGNTQTCRCRKLLKKLSGGCEVSKGLAPCGTGGMCSTCPVGVAAAAGWVLGGCLPRPRLWGAQS